MRLPWSVYLPLSPWWGVSILTRKSYDAILRDAPHLLSSDSPYRCVPIIPDRIYAAWLRGGR